MPVDSDGMNHPDTYEFVIKGHASNRMLGLFDDDFSIDITADRNTVLVGEIRDSSHLNGVINQLTSLAIEIISITLANENAP